jgi:hypothetical protein
MLADRVFAVPDALGQRYSLVLPLSPWPERPWLQLKVATA